MGFLADKVRTDLQNEFFRKHRILFFTNPREYCRECTRYVEGNCRQRLEEYRNLYKKEQDPESRDFL